MIGKRRKFRGGSEKQLA